MLTIDPICLNCGYYMTEGSRVCTHCGSVQPTRESLLRQQTSVMKKYKKLLLALAAIASLYIVKSTGIDQGLIDEVLRAAVEAIAEEEVPNTVEPFEELPAEDPSRAPWMEPGDDLVEEQADTVELVEEDE